LIKLSEDLRVDLLCIHEPYAVNGRIRNFPTTAQVVIHGKQPKATIMNLNSNIQIVDISQFTDEWTVCVELLTEISKYMVVSMYFQFQHDIDRYLDKLESIVNSYPNHKLIITADANAKSPLWHSDMSRERERRRGEQLEDFILIHNLVVYNKEGEPRLLRTERERNQTLTLQLQIKI